MTPRHWIITGVAALLVVLAIGTTLADHQLALHRARRRPSLSARNVKIGTFRRTYFPPGFIAQRVEFLHRKRQDLPPLITVETLTIRASYSAHSP
jgi:hypothetical protein